MRNRCPSCRRLCSTTKPCTTCGSNASMAHSHDCNADHYVPAWSKEYREKNGITAPDGGHYIDDCPNMHVHPHNNWHHHTDDGVIVPDPPTYTASEYKDLVLRLPWVTRVRGIKTCGSYTRRGQCKRKAKFRYRALPGSYSSLNNVYCLIHLPVYGRDPYEMDRAEKWFSRHPEENK